MRTNPIECVPLIVEKLNVHGMTNLGENKEATPETVQKILELCF